MVTRPDCICQKGTIHSVAGEDIPAGRSVMTVREGVGDNRRWVTKVSPFQIHKKVKENDEETVELDRDAARRVTDRASRSDAGGPDY